MIVYNTLVGHVNVVRILHSIQCSNAQDWGRYILTMAFRMADGGSGRDLGTGE